MDSQYDVIVFGGGTAGVVAAVQAGRAGAKALLVEKNGMLGGTMTVGGINAPAHFFAWGLQIIAGIGWELVCRSLVASGRKVPDGEFTRGVRKPKHLGIDPYVYASVCDEAVIESGVEPLFHAMSARVSYNGTDWTIEICTKTGLQTAHASVIIDTTGDANIVSLAGFDVVRPDVEQPATLQLRCSGYDVDALDYESLKRASEDAIARGELKTTDISWYDSGPEAFLRHHGNNANHVPSHGANTSKGRTKVEIEARQALMRAYRFFRNQPGLENFRIDWMCSEVGIRETVTIKGKKTMTVDEYEAGVMYDDAICYAFYPIDEHLNDGRGINQRPLEHGVLPTIPRGAMLPAESRSLIVAGRCIASDRETNSAIRVECPAMATGQAAGAMAALSARSGNDPGALPLDDVYKLLRDHGAVIPGDITLD